VNSQIVWRSEKKAAIQRPTGGFIEVAERGREGGTRREVSNKTKEKKKKEKVN
jgi:hypothetical protein